MVEATLGEDGPLAPANRVARVGQGVKEPLLEEDRRLRGVQVLRLVPGRESAAAEPDRSAALVADREDEPVPETIVRSMSLGTPLEQSRLDEQGLRPAAAEALRERLPTGGGVTDAEAFGDGPGNSPLLEVSGGGSARLRQLGGVEPLRRGDRAEELLALLVARAAGDAPWNRHAEARRERLDRLGEIEPVDLAHEMDHVAAGAAPEAVVQALVAVHGEGGGPLVVKRAETLPRPPRLLQAGVLADDLDDVDRCPQLREHVVVDVEIRRAHAPLSMSSRDSCHPETAVIPSEARDP